MSAVCLNFQGCGCGSPHCYAALSLRISNQREALYAAEVVLRDYLSPKRPLDQYLIPEATEALAAIRTVLKETP